MLAVCVSMYYSSLRALGAATKAVLSKAKADMEAVPKDSFTEEEMEAVRLHFVYYCELLVSHNCTYNK